MALVAPHLLFLEEEIELITRNINLKSLKLRTIIRSDKEEEELELAFATVGIFRYWRSEIKPTHCIVGNGVCKLGVMQSEYDRYSYEELSITGVVDRVIEARIADDRREGELIAKSQINKGY